MIKEDFDVLEFSGYLKKLLSDSGIHRWLFEGGALNRKFSIVDLYKELRDSLRGKKERKQVYRAFRFFKQKHFLRIAILDFVKGMDFSEVVSQISRIAVVSIQVALEFLRENPDFWLGSNRSILWKDKEKEFRFLVIGFGKLGGEELNYVSDVDIAYFYKADNFLYDGLVKLFFQNLTRLLSESMYGDRVFEVDLRLRPSGKEAEIVSTVDFALEYYLNFGHIWDRIALLKSNFVAGDRILGSKFLQEIKPFVFRRFLDFQALEEVREIRDRIIEQSRRSVFKNKVDLKLGIGGIRELEFFVQAFQLIYGGRFPALQERNTLVVLNALKKLELVSQEECDFLKEAYIFLRRLEHCVQLENNSHTSMLILDERKLSNFARALGFESGEILYESLTTTMARVNEIFMSLFESGSHKKIHTSSGKKDILDLTRVLGRFSPQLTEHILDSINKVREELGFKGEEEVFKKGVLRVKRFLSSAALRPGVKNLIELSPIWLDNLIRGIFNSEFVSSLVSSQPSFIEGLNDEKLTSFDLRSWKKQALSLLDGYGFDETIERIRKVKNERVLFLALMDLSGSLPIKDLVFYLSDLADFMIDTTYFALCSRLGLDPDMPFAVCGLGKLGSKEMGYFSDLDLMFVWDPGDGSEIIPEEVVKLAQRLIRMLSINLQEGPGYEVDTRIRPSGNYGPLIVTKNSWVKYYFNEADIWEIQSLLRFRFICGHKGLGSFLEEKVQEICFKKRDFKKVWNRINYLRKRIEKERAKEDGTNTVDVKLGYGGLVDFEFFVQATQLIKGCEFQFLRERSTGRLLNRCFKIWSDSDDASAFGEEAYYGMRWLLERFHLYIGLNLNSVKKDQFENMKDLKIWPPEENFIIETWQDLLNIRRRMRKYYLEIIKV